MREDYLQYIWKQKRVNFNKSKTYNSSNIEVLDWGVYNDQLKGPDFNYAKVRVDGMLFYGSIEIHVKSSDWILHNHHKDPLYNNVILHVVYEYDKPIIQNDYLLPTIELKNAIEQLHHIRFIRKELKQSEIPCEKLMFEYDQIYIERMKQNAFVRKMNAKMSVFNSRFISDKEVFYFLLAEAFGTSTNKNGFHQLIERVPFSELEKVTCMKKKQSLLMAESGLLSHKGSASSEWHFKGSRPANFPVKKVNQFARFVSMYDFKLAFLHLSADEIIKEFKSIVEKYNRKNSNEKYKISRAFTSLILINSVVPFLWYFGNKKEEQKYQDLATNILESIPPEKNRIVKKWENIGLKSKNSYDTQSLLSLYRYYCSIKKCLSCELGKKIIEGR